MNDYRRLKDVDRECLISWWQQLQDNRGERAQLRRADSPNNALLTPAFAQFLRQMPGYWGVDSGAGILLSDAALVATILAHVKEHVEDRSFAKALGIPKEVGGKAVMSELRFQQLQKSRTEDEFFLRMCRALALLDGKVNITSLADNILHWLCEYRFAPANRPQNRLAVKWASDYYSAFNAFKE